MFSINVVETRRNNQVNNYDSVYEALMEGDISVAKDRGNPNKFKEILEYFPCDEKTLSKKCKNNSDMSKAIAMIASKLATRQGGNLEHVILEGIDSYVSKYGVRVKCLSNTAIRPLRSGGIITEDMMKVKKLVKKVDTLKSIDALITGRLDGYIFAKVLTGKGGGHQDNVLIEAHNFIDWAKNENKDNLYVVLIDGDHLHPELPKLMERDSKNIWICDHKQFQKRIIQKVKDDKK